MNLNLYLYNIELYPILIAAGADPDGFPGHYGNPPIIEAIKKRRPDIIKMLIDAGADVYCEKFQANYPLLYAFFIRDDEIIKIFKENIGDINKLRYKGFTILMVAITNYREDKNHQIYYDTIKSIIELGADVNIRGKEGVTALISAVAAQFPSLKIIKLLLDSGADITATDDKGYDAVFYADNRKHRIRDIYEFLSKEKRSRMSRNRNNQIVKRQEQEDSQDSSCVIA